MRKIALVLSTLLVFALTLTGCEWLFAPSVETVSANDLDSYEADQSFKDTGEDDVLNTANGAVGANGSLFAAVFQDVDAELGSAQSVTSFDDAFNVLVQRTTQAVRSQAVASAEGPSRAIQATDNSDDDTLDVEVTVTDETYQATDVGLVSGSATVNDFYLMVYADGDTTDNQDGTTTYAGEGEAEQRANITYTDWSNGVYTIHDGTVNTTANGSVSVDLTVEDSTLTSEGTVSWDFGAAMSAGYSLTRLADNQGGKIIVDFTYWGSENVEITDADEPVNVATSEVEAEMTIVVYDNENTEIARHTYTTEDTVNTAF